MTLVALDELMRSFGREAFTSLAASAGLKVDGHRIQCPFDGCKDHRADRPTNVTIVMGKDGCYHLRCWRCDGEGRYIDLFAALRGLTFEEALTQLRGLAPAAPLTPRLRVVPAPPPADEGKLKPAEVSRFWAACAESDEAGERYLLKRGLHDGLLLGLVRFVTEKHPDPKWKSHAKNGQRIAMLLKDVVGVPMGLQVRLAREQLQTDRTKVLSVKGSRLSGAYFGQPELIEASGAICVTEGMADTIAVSQWAANQRSTCVVGVPGKSNISRLAEELTRTGISVEGRIFILFPQNDRPANASRREFDRLAKLLVQGKANVVWQNVPDEFKDVAKWLEDQFDMPAWPPLNVARAMGLAPEDGTREEARLITPLASVVPVPARFVVEMQAQDFGTLLSILDDPALRYGFMHRQGNWEWNEMTQRPAFARTDISATDWTAIRAGLEVVGRGTANGKPLKWPKEDIGEAVMLLARRDSFHPVRDWLNKNKPWNGQSLLESELPRAMGLEEFSFEARLLKQWMISCVARAMKPGCKVDTVLVLVGPQGTMKSTFFSVMGGEWFTDQSIDIHDKDGRMVIHSAWIVEWAELDTMRRARDAEATKGFITQRVDKFRPPYARDLIEAPRSCVIVGTTNHEDFLTDPTGNRRFWPIKVTSKINIGRIGELRDALWAEALACYIAGEEWHLDATLEEAASLHVGTFVEGDAWETAISDWLKGESRREWIRSADALENALGKPIGTWTRGDEMRVARVLANLGWRRTKKRIHEAGQTAGNGTPSWVFVPPVPTTQLMFPET